ncbi:cytochrome c oxidase assembly factor Coa1 family protein [Dyella sp. GSA-30]|uniref:cytochrome c oxidase assembly factor Coa1 family protein n=1 Tax=Dyella sp. GSA-30 TaxID=2994496 RepID=UPI0024928CF2|nr:cytochrome c oxidase assembly factor Coa1 family protein [Dyella sp. GSA-30]BDU22561.1 hypothetical protein DYGSA30_40180 [Dyella sp. GSA-30]
MGDRAVGKTLGNIQFSGTDGKANLSFSAKGPKGKGTAYIEAVKAMGQWRMEQAVFEDADSKRRIDFHQR